MADNLVLHVQTKLMAGALLPFKESQQKKIECNPHIKSYEHLCY